MGQYYIIVNLDKEECICPHAFGDFAKLMEFGSSSCGTLTGLAILLAGNQGGSGTDVVRHVYWKHKKQPPGWNPTKYERIVDEYDTHELKFRRGKETLKVPLKVRKLAPRLRGTWAGDRIMCISDESALHHLQGCDPVKLLKLLHKRMRDSIASENGRRGESHNRPLGKARYVEESELADHVRPVGLYQYADAYYKDIGPELYASMQAYKICRETEDSFGRRVISTTKNALLRSFDGLNIAGVGLVGNHYNIAWMGPEDFTTMLEEWDDAKIRVKFWHWLQQHRLAPWQQSVLSYLLANKKHNSRDDAVTRIIFDAGFGEKWHPMPLLPKQKFLHAAFALQNEMDPASTIDWPKYRDMATYDDIAKEMLAYLKPAKQPRQRHVELTDD